MHWWSLILKAFATDSIFGRDSYSKVLSETLEYVQRTATQILNAIGADGSSAPSPVARALPTAIPSKAR